MRSRYKIYPDSGIYFIASTVRDWVPIIINEAIFKIILESFKFCQKQKDLLIFGFVIMMNHFHIIIGMEESDKIPGVIRDLKRHTSQEISKFIANSEKQNKLFWLKPFYSQKVNYVWQEGYHPVLIKSEEWFQQKLDYMHFNPVKKGLVDEPEFWKYSSARNYILEDDSLIKLDWDKL